MKNKIISLITVIALVLSLLSINTSAVQTKDLSGVELLKQYVLEDALDDEEITSTKLIAGDKASVNATYLQSYVESNGIAKQAYGGCYIGDDDKLYVLLTDKAAENTIDTMKEMTKNTIVIEECQYSLDELMALKEYIGSFWDSNESIIAEVMKDVMSIGIDEMNNRIVVSIKDCSEDKINLFRKYICDFSEIEFEDTQGYLPKAVNMYAGGHIVIGSYAYSMGFRCRILNSAGTYNYGFVTAAHGNSIGQGVYYNNAFIGMVSKRSYANNGPLDTSFVLIADSNYVATNDLIDAKGTLVAGAYMTNFAVNQNVGISAIVVRHSTGKITMSSVDVNTSNGKITDLVRATYWAYEGDSGGVVYAVDGSSKYVSGINVIGAEDENLNFYVKVTNIRNNFGVTLY